MIQAVLLTAVLLACFDAVFTGRVQAHEGVAGELNPLVCKWPRFAGAAIVLPTVLVALVVWVFESLPLACFLLGLRSGLFVLQLSSIRLHPMRFRRAAPGLTPRPALVEPTDGASISC